MSIITRNNRRENRKTRQPVAGRWPVSRPESFRISLHCSRRKRRSDGIEKTRTDTVKRSLTAVVAVLVKYVGHKKSNGS